MTAPIRVRLAILALFLCAPPCAFSQAPEQQPSLTLREPDISQRTLVPPVRPFQLRPRIGVLAETHLSLQQALALALTNNKDIESSRIDQEEAEYSLTGARGVFDPVASGNSYWEKQVTPIASALGGSATGAVLNKIWNSDPALSENIPWFGGSYRIDFSNQRVFTDNSFVTLNPQYPLSLNLQYTQPLWRGLRYDANRHAIDVAKKNLTLTDEQFRQRVMQVTEQAERGYWELVYAYNNLQVQLEAVGIAQQQDESNRRQEQQGLLAPIDVVAAQTQLANFEIGAFAAQTALAQAENALKTLILPDRSSPMWSSALVPTTPAETAPPLTPLDDAIQEALADRPEVAEVRISSDINKDDTRLYRNLTKPQVDLVASYDRAGLSGLVVPGPNPLTAGFLPIVDRLNQLSVAGGLEPINVSALTGSATPQLLIGSYGQAASTLWNGNFPTTEVQLRISLPIRNRTAEANLSRSLAEEHRIRNQREQVEQNIQSDVRTTMQSIQSARASLDAARVARESAEEQYQSEQRQFRAGTSTLFLVQQRQSTMIAARSQERRAEADLAEAIASYELATASILRQHDINLK
jgi:outer membrane protein TolC